jgi:hypothetical protein
MPLMIKRAAEAALEVVLPLKGLGLVRSLTQR